MRLSRSREKFMDIMKSDNAKPINIIDAEAVFVRNEKRLSTNVESLYKPHQRSFFVLATPKFKSLDIEALVAGLGEAQALQAQTFNPPPLSESTNRIEGKGIGRTLGTRIFAKRFNSHPPNFIFLERRILKALRQPGL
jgi:hypothetical protein